jgi:hypothetical protein
MRQTGSLLTLNQWSLPDLSVLLTMSEQDLTEKAVIAAHSDAMFSAPWHLATLPEIEALIEHYGTFHEVDGEIYLDHNHLGSLDLLRALPMTAVLFRVASLVAGKPLDE